MKDPEFKDDPLDSVLGEWRAPEPPLSLDANVRAAFHAHRPSIWQRAWNVRISIPAPMLAALVLCLAAAFWWRTRSIQVPTLTPNTEAGYITKVENAGFQPLPDGAVRIIRAADSKGAPRQ